MKNTHKISIKPLSLNMAYRGRRFATPALKQFKEYLNYLLPKIIVPKGKLQITYRFGVSSKSSDADNLSKTITDCIATKYNFNDKIVYKFILEKIDVKKGGEFIEFEIEQYV